MRRGLVTLLAAAVGAGLWTAPASAGLGSIKVRSDPNDTTSVLDIWKVGTDMTRRRVFLLVRTYDPFGAGDLVGADDSYFVFLLDTKNRGRADKYAYMYWDSSEGRFECAVFNRDGGFKGERGASKGSMDISCFLPRRWFDIQKTVQFGVESYELGIFRDRAPNDGRYRGL